MPAVNLLENYAAVGYNDSNYTPHFVPPDTIRAAGPSAYVESVNQVITPYNPKTANAAAVTDTLDHFYFTTGGLPHAGTYFGLSDPIVAYDELIGRFIVGDQDVDFNVQHLSTFNFAVSKTSTPTGFTAADWNFYQIDTTKGSGYVADSPGPFGYNKDAFVFTLNMFQNGETFDHVQVNTVIAADLAAGVSQASLHAYQTDMDAASLRPVVMHDSKAGEPMWLIEEGKGASTINVMKMDNVLSDTPTFTSKELSVNSYTRVEQYGSLLPRQRRRGQTGRKGPEVVRPVVRRRTGVAAVGRPGATGISAAA